jgi:hypothetical protein
MAESPKSGSGKPTPLIRVGIAFGLGGAVVAVWAVTDMMHAHNEAFVWDAVILFAAALALGVSGYLFWGYRYLSKRPELRPGTAEGNRRLSERAQAWLKWRRIRRRAMAVIGLPLGIISIGLGVFLIVTGSSGGAFTIALGAIVLFMSLRFGIDNRK